MKKLSYFFLSSILYKKIYDEYDEYLGKLWDIYVTTDENFPKAIGYKIKKNGEFFNYEFRNVIVTEDNKGKVIFGVKGTKEIIPRTYSYLLSKNLLDKQIVDINGKKLIRVNDLRMAKIAGEIKVVAVDTGILSLCRRLGIENFAKDMMKFFKRSMPDSLIMWDDVESLEMVNSDLKLAVPYQKLSKMHPADIADILEEMDAKYRNMVFQSLNQDLAADTLEEIEPEIQANILESLSNDKTAELLDSVPNDEIADMLDEVDEETAEKILLNMEKEDAEEVRELMGYEDETAGSIMNKDFIAFNINISAGETIDLLREIKPDAEVAYYIYITDEAGKLQGVVSLRNLIVAPPGEKLKEIMDSNVIYIKDRDSINEAIEIATKYDLLSIPVIDEEDVLCGIIIMSDIIDEVLVPNWRRKIKKVM